MINDNIAKVKERIVASCVRAGRNPAEITIVCVSKDRTVEQIKQALVAGLTDIGENRVQEALLKFRHLTPNSQHLTPIRWHMVGHLQTNKVKDAVRIFDLIHSVDTLHLAQEIDKQAAKIGKVQDVLIQVNTAKEPGKFGLSVNQVLSVIQEMAKLKNLCIKGLMTIAPLVDDAEKARPYFRLLRELKETAHNIKTIPCELNILSMGMTNDFEVAIEEGATMIRLGRAIFEG